MSRLAYAISKLIALYENLDSYSNNMIRKKIDEIIKELREIDDDGRKVQGKFKVSSR